MGSKDVYELTNPQKSIWDTEQFFKGTNINNIIATLTIKQDVDMEILKKAINIFLKNNKSFELKFKMQENRLVQYFTEMQNIDFEVLYLKDYEEVKKIAKELVEETFDIEKDQLFKYKLYKLDNGFGGFIIMTHHIISDAATFSIMGTEIVDNYTKLEKNENIEIKQYTYEEYIKDEKEYENSSKFSKDKEYWEGLFNNVPEVATIPSMQLKSNANLLGKALREEFFINQEFLSKISIFCKKYKISNFNFFMAVYAIYLSRVCNLHDFVIGTPILNRTNFKEKHTTGMFINTAPLRIKIEDNIDFITFAKHIAQSSLSMLRYQKYPYQKLLEDLRKKDNNIPTLFDVMLSYQVTKANDRTMETPYEVEWLPTNTISNGIYIHLHDNDDNGTLNVAYDYQIEKYTKQDIENIHKRILNIINQVLDNENCLEQDIEIVTQEEKNQILNEFNNTYTEYPRDKTIVDLFEEQVEKTPDNIAVVFGEQSLTYKELNEKANALANYLVKQGIKQDNIVGILLDRSIEMIISILAVLKSGGAYIPIDPDYPAERIQYMLEDSKCKLLLSKNEIYSKMNIKVAFIDVLLQRCDLYNNKLGNLNIKINQNDLSYIIYTSGSTGKPKGVMLTHKGISNLTNYCNNYIEYLKNNEYKAIVSVTTISFDIFFFESIISLQKGLKLVIANQEEQTIPRLLANLIKKENIEIIQTTPSRMKLIVDSIENQNSINNLKYIILAGEQFPITLAKELRKIGKIKLYNGYGPSETTVFSTLTDVTDVEKMTIGKPLDNTQIYILDSKMNLCPIGVAGEIYISGDGVGRGYINKEELTQKSYLNNKFNKNSLLYKTGDLGIYNEDGTIECLGRIDNQVKIRGLRIELEEIEKAILEIEEIKNCVVVKKQSKDGHEFLCAYYVINKKIEVSRIRETIQKKLTKYMIPQYFVELDKIPYTPNGKIDRKVLPMPTLEENKNIVLPRNEQERKLKDIFEEVLRQKNISIEDSFFELGGDSLSAIKLSTKIYEKLKVEVGIKHIFENATIIKLANVLNNMSDTKKIKTIKKIKKKDYYPTSSAQKRMYYASVIDEKSTVYNISGGLLVDKKIDIEKLNYCFNKLIEENESLRTYFEIEEGEIVQKIQNEIEFKIEEEKATHSNISKIGQEFIRPFNLSKAPLIRAKVTELRNGKTILLIDMHHIIADGETIKIIAKEISNTYNGLSNSKKEIEYKDFAVWENEEEFERQEKYWLSIYEDEIPTLELPTNYSRPSTQSFEGKSIIKKLDKETVEKINSICKEMNITPYMLLLSIYYILLSEYSTTNDIVIGTPVVGRKNNQLQNIIGMFVNTLPIRNKIKQEEKFEEFVNRVKQNCLQAFENQEYPLDRLIKKLNIQKDTSRNALFDVVFTYQNEGYPTIKFDDINAKFYALESNISKFDITLEAIMEPDELTLRFEYCTKLFTQKFIEEMSKHYMNILKVVTRDKEIQIVDIEMISQDEKNHILKETNTTQTVYEREKTVIQLFEEQVEKTPKEVALVYNDKEVTYEELNEKSNQLADYMKKQYNIKNQDKVAIFVRKSLESIIAILATIKIGAIFVPIDVEYPEDRIEYILKDSNAKLILTSSEFKEKIKIDISKVNIELDTDIYISNNKKNVQRKLDIKDLIYIMYTSGSTGKPKGVMIEHRNVVRLVRNTNYIDFSIKQKILQTGSIVFDACTFEIWGALVNGGTLYLLDKEKMLDSNYFEVYLKKKKITSIFLTTALFNQYCEASTTIFSTLTNLLTGGEAVSCKHMKLAKNNFPNLNIVHVYGPTENTTFSTYYNVEEVGENTVPIGKAISNSTTYVVSKNGKIQPIGVPGELWVGGDGVGRGYLNREDLTKEKFIKNPFDEGRVYKTGDLVKLLPDGNIEFIGRIDNQIKIRGFRVELSEIDNVIKQYPNISKIFTLVKDLNGNKTIITYFTASKKLNVTDIIAYLQERLPYYMVPQYMIQIETFPLTVNGKIDKSKLPIPEARTSSKYFPSENKEQEKLCEIWSKLFNIKKVSIMDNFFELGGDSLLAIRLQTEALKHDININYSDIFEYQTIKALSEKQINDKLYEIDTNYNYSKINELLKINNISNIEENTIEIKEPKIDNLLLLGATGFLGAHILDEYLSNTDGNVYCLVRRKNNEDSELRLKHILNFYFGDKYDDKFNNRIHVVYGDITKEKFGLRNEEYKEMGEKIGTVINSAALVKHFGDFDMFNSINVLGTRNIIKFCQKFNKKMYHISTMSVAGMTELDKKIYSDEERILFGETQLYIEQNLKNPYVYTKFQAEKEILEQMANGRLEACILRMGNIFNRVSDGKFQINVSENAYINRIKAILSLGVVQKRFLNHALEFTPVDSSAKAIIEIVKHNPKFNVFHIFNTNLINFPSIIAILNNLGYNIQLVNDEEFSNRVKEFLKDEELKSKISGLIPDLNKDKTLGIVAKTLPDAYFTTQYLKSIGFKWPEIDKEYVQQFFNYFRKIGYIE